MSIIRWSPFRELEEMHTRLNRLFVDRSPANEDDALLFAGYAPAVDIQETDREYIIKADLPEVKKEDVKVAVEEGVLTFEGERRMEKEEKDKKFHKIEREYGKFMRRFAVPTDVDPSKVSADFKDGVLNVHLPKAEMAKPRSIEVKVA